VALGGCEEVVQVVGAEAAQAPRMGFYKQTGESHDGRPIYENINDQFLYFWSPYKEWRIGDSFSSPYAGVKSKAGEDADCPDEATGWVVFESEGWSTESKVEIHKAFTPPVVAEVATLRRSPLTTSLRRGRSASASWIRSHAFLLVATAGVAMIPLFLVAAAVAAARARHRTASAAGFRSLGMTPGAAE